MRISLFINIVKLFADEIVIGFIDFISSIQNIITIWLGLMLTEGILLDREVQVCCRAITIMQCHMQISPTV